MALPFDCDAECVEPQLAIMSDARALMIAMTKGALMIKGRCFMA
jgi:hypothetical protein